MARCPQRNLAPQIAISCDLEVCSRTLLTVCVLSTQETLLGAAGDGMGGSKFIGTRVSSRR